jgi:SAM-dependent methyltransferase
VTGIDISDEAIDFARALSAETGIAAVFERADVYDWFAASEAQFEVAFSSYGALAWLSDIAAWARGVARVLAPAGRLVIVEFHPSLNLFDWHGGFNVNANIGGGVRSEYVNGIGDYVEESGGALSPSGHVPATAPFTNPEPCHEWDWSIVDVLDAVARAGLRIEHVREWPYSNGCRFFSNMVALEGRRWALPPSAPKLPLMYGFVASRDAR